jgi:hypothetical protein
MVLKQMRGRLPSHNKQNANEPRWKSFLIRWIGRHSEVWLAPMTSFRKTSPTVLVGGWSVTTPRRGVCWYLRKPHMYLLLDLVSLLGSHTDLHWIPNTVLMLFTTALFAVAKH